MRHAGGRSAPPRDRGANPRAHDRNVDYAARSGGDDFVFIHTGDREPRAPFGRRFILAKELIAEIQASPFRWNGKEFPINVSVGIVCLDSSFKNEHEIMIAGTQIGLECA